MQSVLYAECHKLALHTERHYAECRGTYYVANKVKHVRDKHSSLLLKRESDLGKCMP
jgi:hypothetical protein